MRLHRFIGTFDVDAAHIDAQDSGLAHQIANVFRLRESDEVILCDGNGRERTFAIVELGKRQTSFTARGDVRTCPAPRREVTLCAALLRRENFELVVQKAVECGVTRIVPLVTRRTVKQAFRADRLGKIAVEAAEQCGRGFVPAIANTMTLEEALVVHAGAATKAFCDFGGMPAAKALQGSGAAVLFIGPEGGWDAEERALAERRGCGIADLGAMTLRGETAAIVAAWLAVNA